MHLSSKSRLSCLSRIVATSVLSLVLTGCFGEGDGAGPDSNGVASGKLVFSDTEGVTFESASRDGVTGPDSAFSCLRGETVRFAIGDIDDGIILGSAACAPLITAVQLTGSSSPTDQAAINQIRFIHSLDENQNPNDGVFIPQAVRDAAATYNYLTFDSDFDQAGGLGEAVLALTGNPPISETRAIEAFCFNSYLPQGAASAFGFSFDSCRLPAPRELLLNGSFEEEAVGTTYDFYWVGKENGAPFSDPEARGSFPVQWRDGFNQFYDEGVFYASSSGANSSDYQTRTGDKSLRLAGPDFFNLPYPEAEGNLVDQEFRAVAGQSYTASIWVLNSDPLRPGEGSLYTTPVGDNLFVLSLIFSCNADSNDEECDYTYTTVANGNPDVTDEDVVYLEPDVWTEVTITATAPLDTRSARLRIGHIQFPRSEADSATPGNIARKDLSAVFVDDASLVGVPAEPAVEYALVWSEEFDVDGDFTSGAYNDWTAQTGFEPSPGPAVGSPGPGWGNEEWQEYTTDPRDIRVESGYLKITANCGYLDAPGNSSPLSANLLDNTGFTDPSALFDQVPAGGGCSLTTIGTPGWDANNCNVVRNVAWTPDFTQQSPNPRTTADLQMLRQYDDSTVRQTTTALVAGNEVTASAWVQNWDGVGAGSSDPTNVLSSNGVGLAIEFYNGAALISRENCDTDASTLTPNQWIKLTCTAEAPANTTSAVMELYNCPSGGVCTSTTAPIWWDDASLQVRESPACNIGGTNGRNGEITSGRITTSDTLTAGSGTTFGHGKIEARMKVPVGMGAFPAFWMLGANYLDVGWPFAGEIDISEVWTQPSANPNGDETQTHATLHWCNEEHLQFNPASGTCFTGFLAGGHASEGGGGRLGDPPHPSLGDNFHVYTLEWSTTQLVFKIDGELVWRKDIDPGTMEEFVDKEFHLIFNFAMGGSLGSNSIAPAADGSNWEMPQTLEVDWVKYFEVADL